MYVPNLQYCIEEIRGWGGKDAMEHVLMLETEVAPCRFHTSYKVEYKWLQRLLHSI